MKYCDVKIHADAELRCTSSYQQFQTANGMMIEEINLTSLKQGLL